MSSGATPTVTARKEKISNGHNVHYRLTVPNIHTLQAWPFAQTYRTNCQDLPSSWRFEMTFHGMAQDSSVSFSFFLKRKKSKNSIVNGALFRATVWVAFTTVNGSPIFPPTVFSKDILSPGEEILKSVETIPPLSDMGQFLGQELVVEISIMIRFCHTEG
ncbi:hypothetical protein AVEN_48998-1 [Araneus ventricosus]|uniref:MATH domain-containing protein n=1 Tax=Araneus ventricosus TaxID=182803 RepID=A0A4Y2AGR0_ARAVE|nr:hypothetical protein AVEN_48998-1 [Araneus ventricosus]